MKQLSNKTYQKLKTDVLAALKQTQENFIKRNKKDGTTGNMVYVAPMSVDDLEYILVRNGYVDLQNGPKLTKSGVILVELCGVEL